MMWFLLPLVLLCIVQLNTAKLMNVQVTINKTDIYTLFDDSEIWSIQYKNVTQGTVQVEVVIDEAKATKILQYPVVMGFDIIHADAEQAIEKTKKRLDNRTRWQRDMKPDFFFQEYRDWIEYQVFLEYLDITYQDLVTIEYLPVQTLQGRDIPVVIVTTDGDFTKPGFYLQACLHAREWIANSALTFILNELLEGYRRNDPRIEKILQGVNFFIVPTVNIDGYIYSWTTYRMWRKNRRANSGGSYGVDLNRNYAAMTSTSGCNFCGVGASSNPSSDTYCGTSAFSEPEVQASVGFMTNETLNIQATWDMHTSGPLILSPYGCTNSQPPGFQALGVQLQAEVAAVHGVQYIAQSAWDLYPCSGTAVDFGYAGQDMGQEVYSFTFEGRGPGFNPDPSNIIPAGEEEMAAVLYMAEVLMGPDLREKYAL